MLLNFIVNAIKFAICHMKIFLETWRKTFQVIKLKCMCNASHLYCNGVIKLFFFSIYKHFTYIMISSMIFSSPQIFIDPIPTNFFSSFQTNCNHKNGGSCDDNKVIHFFLFTGKRLEHNLWSHWINDQTQLRHVCTTCNSAM